MQKNKLEPKQDQKIWFGYAKKERIMKWIQIKPRQNLEKHK